MAIAASLGQVVRESEAHVFLKAGKKVSAREVQKILSLGVHQLDWIELIVDGEEEEEPVAERIRKLLCNE